MNCEEFRRRTLLSDSGELPANALRELDEHAGACGACRSYRDSASRIIAAARKTLPGGEPSPVVMSRIRTAAEERKSSGLSIFRQPVFQALACAAAVALLLGGGWLVSFSSGHGRSKRIDQVHTIAAVISSADVERAQHVNGGENDTKLRALAHQLLIMEGLDTEDVMNAWLSGYGVESDV